MKYRASVYDDVIDYYKENLYTDITKDDVDKMERKDVLRYWLEWNGIIGYDYYILDILGNDECLYTKQDLIKAINAYADVLRGDMAREKDETIKDVLNNVAYSLNQIVKDFDC